MNELALFAGAGGGILGGKLLGWRTVCAVEYEPHAAAILVQRQNDGILQPFPIWDDVRTFDGKPWRGIVDVVSGGFPCQDISTAGRGKGISGERSGLWTEMARIIREVRPRYALVENSPLLTIRGLEVVLGDLASMGYDAKWGVFSAADVGARHQRERVWIVADSNGFRFTQQTGERPQQYVDVLGQKFWKSSFKEWPSIEYRQQGKKNNSKSMLLRTNDGVSDWVDRIARIGNGQVPAVVRLAWEILGPGSNETESSKNT